MTFRQDTLDKNRPLNQMYVLQSHIFLLSLAELSNLSLQPILSDAHCSLQSATLLTPFPCSHLEPYLAIPVVLAIRVALSTQAVLEDLGDQGHLWQLCFVQWYLVNLGDLRESNVVLGNPRQKRALKMVAVVHCFCYSLLQSQQPRALSLQRVSVIVYERQKSALGGTTKDTSCRG